MAPFSSDRHSSYFWTGLAGLEERNLRLDQSNFGNPCLAIPNPEFTDGDTGAAIEFCMFGGFATPELNIDGTVSEIILKIPKCSP